MNHLLQWPRAAKRLFVVVLDACMGVLAGIFQRGCAGHFGGPTLQVLLGHAA